MAVSPRLTNEEAFAVKTLADSIGARLLSFDHRENGLARVLGKDRSPNTIDELLSTEVILTVGFNAWGSVLRAKLKQAAENGGTDSGLMIVRLLQLAVPPHQGGGQAPLQLGTVEAEPILTVGFNAWGSVLRAKLKQAAENGARIVAIAPQGMEQKD